jgi:methylmalonyl-CoA/ethylmalonyl-CoA epimerase
VIELGPLHHVGQVVEDLDAAIADYERVFGMRVTIREQLVEQDVEAAMLESGGGRVELIRPTDPEGPVARFLEARGPGMHHVAFAVPDVAAALAEVAAAGGELIDERPRVGLGGHRVAFVHPRSAHGVLIELVED